MLDKSEPPKLVPRFISPFVILQAINDNAMRLKLPRSMSRVHDVFNVDRLKHYHPNEAKFASRPIPKATPVILDESTGEQMYIVEKLLKKRQFNRKLEYLVKWHGQPESEATWELMKDIKHVVHFKQLVQDLELSATEAIDQGEWIEIVYKLSVYLRAQSNLILCMGVTCPKKTNRWLHLGMVVDFILKYNSRITSYIADRPNNAARPPMPTPTFWVITAAVNPAIARMNRTFVELQERSLIISQQRGFLDSMLTDLVVLFSIKDARTNAAGMDQLRADEFYKEEEWWVDSSSLIEFIEDLGMHANDNWGLLEDDGDGTAGSKAHVLRVLCEYAVKLIIRLQKMQAECDEINHAAVLEAPACMPVDLAKMRPKLLRDAILMPRLARVRLFFSNFHHRDLVKAYKDEPGIKWPSSMHTTTKRISTTAGILSAGRASHSCAASVRD
ncbi:hypothetical protein H257_17835 [Aphanomyces astaci]|uniref:Chromo domain-containing protein n=1 Tax=Aphanomyces astaci TaxID=112090 RepID=W4FD86_APHAT|nr:hypothetical protein H257_17835 [Aphanomyces astaci]ETV65440.1 hypothetical protein H257_17835 [Aphanomyces astaci]|eukprot:XP_009845083.1 hypothetical protein H257_17835 [Aphanomyces astaci]